MLWAVRCRGEQPPASYPQVRLGQPPGPDVLTAPMQKTGVGISEQHLIAQPKAHHTSFSTKSVWKHISCVWTSSCLQCFQLLLCSRAAMQRAVASVTNACTPPRQAGCSKSHPSRMGRQRAADSLCSAQHPHHARTNRSNVTVGCAATAIAQFAPLSRQAECLCGSLCPPHPQRSHHLGTVLPRSLASSCHSNSML